LKAQRAWYWDTRHCACVGAHHAYAAVVVGLVRSGIRSRRLPRNPLESQESWSEMNTTLYVAPKTTSSNLSETQYPINAIRKVPYEVQSLPLRFYNN